VVEEEQFGGQNRSYKRKGMAKGAIENVMTALRWIHGLDMADYDIHLNFPGGVPVDGPSAGVAVAVALYSAIQNMPVNELVAMTGEVSVLGKVKPVGGIMTKVEAARRAGIRKVIIPRDNWLKIFNSFNGITVVPVDDLHDVFAHSIIGYERDLDGQIQAHGVGVI